MVVKKILLVKANYIVQGGVALKMDIHIENLCKSFGNQPVLRQINLNIHKGEFVAVLGPKGSIYHPRCGFCYGTIGGLFGQSGTAESPEPGGILK